jgi:beta-lactamase regulating signal transducer with metallopeptidase domain
MDPTRSNEFLSILGRNSLEGTILILLVLAAQFTFRQRITPRWRCVFWLLVVVRLALPFSVGAVTSVFNLLPPWQLPRAVLPANPSAAARPGLAVGTPIVEPVPGPAAGALAPSPVDTHPLPPGKPFHRVPSVLLLVWAAGALFLSSRVLVSWMRFRERCRGLQPLSNPAVVGLLNECCRRLGVLRKPALLESPDVGSPALHGVFRPRLLLPAGFLSRFSLPELQLIFFHELAHQKRRDLLLGWIMAGLQAVHWFNPVVWFAFGRWRHDRELACDAVALDAAGANRSLEYGQTILRLLENYSRPIPARLAVGILEDKYRLRHRIDWIANYAPARHRSWLALALVTGLAVVGLTDATNSSVFSDQSGTNNELKDNYMNHMNQPNRLTRLAMAGLIAANLSSVATPARADDGTNSGGPSSDLSKQLIGTWVLVGSPDHIGQVPEAGGRYKFYSGKYFCMTQADPERKVVMFHHGGTYTVSGHEYSETITYANPSTIQFIGRTNGHFNIKIEGDLLELVGIDNGNKEAWRRLAPAADVNSSPIAARMMGAWVLVGAPGHVGKAPESNGRIKFITAGGWCDTESDPKTSIVMNHHGGTWTFEDKTYVQTVDYADPGTLSFVGHSFKFKPKLKGDTLTLIGVENPWQEVWQRLE